MGLSFEGFEEELIPMFTNFEVIHYQRESASNSKLVYRRNKELKRLACSINMILNVEVLAIVELRVGVSQFFVKPKLLSWNVRRLNEGDKRLRVRNLL